MAALSRDGARGDQLLLLNSNGAVYVNCLRLTGVDCLHVGIPRRQPVRELLLRKLLSLHLSLLIMLKGCLSKR
jgi:hypothetical protein